MRCKEVQRILFATKADELDPPHRSKVEMHIAGCRDCRAVRDAVVNADQKLEKLKAAVPRLRNEHMLTDSVVTSILESNEAVPGTIEYPFIDRLSIIFGLRVVRIVCSAVIIFCITGYISLEYRDMEQILSMERKMGRETDLSQANFPVVRDEVLNGLYNVYKLSAGDKSIADITDELVLMQKKDLETLLVGNDILNRLPQQQLDRLFREYRSNRTGGIDTTGVLHDLNALKKEINRLKKEFDQQSQRRGK